MFPSAVATLRRCVVASVPAFPAARAAVQQQRAFTTYRSGCGLGLTGTTMRSAVAASSSSSLPLCSSLRFGGVFTLGVRHATKKAGGSSKNSQDSIGKRLGLKKSAGQLVKPGHILVRQRGQKVHPGKNVGSGRDDTLHALVAGRVCISYLALPFHARKRARKYIHVLRDGETPEQVKVESEEKSKQLTQLVALHRSGVWLPSPKQLKMRQRARDLNTAKLESERVALAEALADPTNLDDKIKNHPMLKIRALRAQQQTA